MGFRVLEWPIWVSPTQSINRFALPFFQISNPPSTFFTHALNAAERSEANWVGLLFALALFCLIPFFLGVPLWGSLGFRLAFQWIWLIPAITLGRHCDEGWPSWVMRLMLILMVSLALGGLGLCLGGLWMIGDGNQEDGKAFLRSGLTLWNLNVIVGFINFFLGYFLSGIQVKK